MTAEREINCAHQAERCPQIVQLQRFAQITQRKRYKDRKGNDLLQQLQLRDRKRRVADPVGKC